MSHYPPNGYQWPVQGSQQPPAPSQPQEQYMYQQPGYTQDRPYPSYQAYPSYPAYQTPGPATEHYALSQASFNHNATQIPGLGISSPPAASPSQSVGGPWGSYGAPGGVTAAKPQQQAPTQAASHVPSNDHQPGTLSTTAPASSNTQKTTQSLPVDVFDDGELSEEGLFDDLYDPDPPISTRSPPKKTVAFPQAEAQQANEETDLDLDNTFYEDDEGDEPGEISSNTNGAHHTVRAGGGDRGEKQRSTSYSPDLSPREIHNRDGLLHQGNMADQLSQMQGAVLGNP